MSDAHHGHEHDEPDDRRLDAREHHVHEPLDYADAVEAFRARKDKFFRTADQSPVPVADREGFTGLPYYPVDPGLRFEDLTLEPYTGDEPVRFEIPTSDGRLRPAERAGVFHFVRDGTEHTLTAYTLAGGSGESLFVPFLDATSGNETYGAGRYLDLEPDAHGTWSLDFNLAYHPSCVYDQRFSCPITPAENRLPVRIAAGERLPLSM